MNIILIGFKGAGKSTIGKIVARKKDMDFIDTDKLIEQLHEKEKHQKQTCRQIFKTHGEDYFRNLETRAIKPLKQQDNLVIAVGGGILERDENRKSIINTGRIVYLLDDKDLIFKRIKEQGFPPFFDKKNPKASFEKLFKERSVLYKKTADTIILCKGKSIKEIAEEITNKIQQ